MGPKYEKNLKNRKISNSQEKRLLVIYPLKLIEVIKVNMDLSLFIQWLGLLSCKQLTAPTRHRAFILQRSVRSCLHTSNIVGCTIGFRNLQGPSPSSLRRGGAGYLTNCLFFLVVLWVLPTPS